MKCFALVATCALSAAALADVKVDLSPYVNTDMQTFLFGNNFPLGGSTLDVGGVNFDIATLGGNPNTTGAIERPYHSSQSVTVSGLNVQITEPTSLYTLVSEQFGFFGSYLGYITVHGAKGESSTLQLVSGANVGNNWTAGSPIALTDSSVVVQYVRAGLPTDTLTLDTMAYSRQELALSGSFIGDTVTSIDYVSLDFGDPNRGVAVFGAATFAQTGVCCCNPVPEPASCGLLAAGLLGLSKRRRRSA